MTIRPGEDWGESVARPEGLAYAHSDADLGSLVSSEAPVAVDGGDLHRALGSPPARAEMQRLPLDVLDVTVDHERRVAVAHVVARKSWWRGPLLAVCNVGWMGDWNVAPRAHPNDGRFDVLEVSGSMTARERWKARRRLPAGTHVPHPQIATRSATTASWEFPSELRLWIDGEPAGGCRSLQVSIRPDAMHVHC